MKGICHVISNRYPEKWVKVDTSLLERTDRYHEYCCHSVICSHLHCIIITTADISQPSKANKEIDKIASVNFNTHHTSVVYMHSIEEILFFLSSSSSTPVIEKLRK